MLSFLFQDELPTEIQFNHSYSNASYYIQNLMTQHTHMFDHTTYPHIFTSLPVSLKYVNKMFHKCFNEMFHIMAGCIVSIQNNSKLFGLPHFPNCQDLVQLYLVQDLSFQTDAKIEEIYSVIKNLQRCKFQFLRILQIHFFFGGLKSIDFDMNDEHFPMLDTLILGTIFNDHLARTMMINKLNLDLDITELRIQNCCIYDIDSLRFSLARCTLITELFLILKPHTNSKQQTKQYSLYSLYLPNTEIAFIQSDALSELRIFAPKLLVIQFYFCDKLDTLILLDKIPGKLRSHVIGEVDETAIDEEIVIGFDNCVDDLIERHIPKFRVLKNGKVYTDECEIQFTCACRSMLVWPYASY